MKGLEFDHVYLARAAPGRDRRPRHGGRVGAALAHRRRDARAGRRAGGDAPLAPRLHLDDPGPRGPGALVVGGDRRQAGSPLAAPRGGSRGARRGGGRARRGAVRPGRGPPLDLPDGPRRGARGLVARGLGDLGDAARHGRGRQPRRRPVPRAAEAGLAGAAARARSRRRRRSADINELLARVATPEQRAVLETSALDDYMLRRGARARGAPGHGARAATSPRSISSSRARTTGSRSRPRTSTSTGSAPCATSSRASSRSRRSRRSTSASGS